MFKATVIILIMGMLNVVNAGDTPCNSINISNNMQDPAIYSNFGNTDSGISNPPNINYYGADMWFDFTFSSSGTLYLEFEELGLSDMAVAIYSQSCNNVKLLYNVKDNNCNNSQTPAILLTDLTPGETYYIRIWSEINVNGNFSIFLRETLSVASEFLLSGDASLVGECIQLTPDLTGKKGCVWYEDAIDFSEAFEHIMVVNFGDDDAGADGICLVYQSNSTTECGVSGRNIGAGGIPNSAIFEFDTYQNNSYLDPAEDHVSFNVNGNMNHFYSIEGPINTNGNIEDGLEHEIIFSWNPIGNLYELSFDGNVLLSGSYDFINNCFNGSNFAYWGYTASTGGHSNEQVVCPQIAPEYFGTQSYDEQELCYGDSYQSYTTSGFYTEIESPIDNCSHQNNLNITIRPETSIGIIDTMLCVGETLNVLGNTYYAQSGTTNISETLDLLDDFGCDSSIDISIDVIETTITLDTSGVINCNGGVVELSSSLDHSVSPNNVVYEWTDPIGLTFDTPNITGVRGGLYILFVYTYYSNGIICTTSEQIYVDEDTDLPYYFGPNDQELTCDGPESVQLEISNYNPSFDIEWYSNGELIDSIPAIIVNTPGTYEVKVINPLNGCYTIKDAKITQVGDVPQFEISGEDLNCQYSSATLAVDSIPENTNFFWTYNNDTISYDSSFTISEGGTYTAIAIDQDGCKGIRTINILEDKKAPDLMLNNMLVPCGEDSMIVNVGYNENYIYQWTNNSTTIGEDTSLILYNEGTYMITILDTTNYCENSSTFEVDFKGAYPSFGLYTTALTCDYTEVTVYSDISEESYNYQWTYNGMIIGNEPTVQGTSPGNYILQVTSVNGCTTIDSVNLSEKKIYPQISLSATDISCVMKSSSLSAQTTDATIVEWTTPDGILVNNENMTSNVPGVYYFKATNQLTGCSTYDSIEVVSNINYPSITLNEITLDCNNPLLPLDVTANIGSGNATWDSPSGATLTGLNPLVSEAGTYQLHLDIPGFCELDTVVMVTIDTIKPEFSVSYNTITCDRSKATISVLYDSGAEVEILDPNNNVETISYPSDSIWFQVTEADTYTIQVTNENGCTSNAQVEVLALLDPPVFDVNQFSILDCNTTTVNINITPTNPNWDYSWALNNNQLSQSDNITVTQSGEYYLTVINEYGCEIVEIIEVEEDYSTISFDAQVDDSLTCITDEVNLYTNPNNEIWEYYWYSSEGLNSQNMQYLVTEPGQYIAKIIGPNGCESFDTILVQEYIDVPFLKVEGTHLDCNHTEAYITSQIEEMGQVTWKFPDGTIHNGEEFSILSPGTYQASFTNQYGCENNKFIEITQDIESPTIHLLSGSYIEIIEDGEGAIITDIESKGDPIIEWIPSTGLSCTDCESPTLNDMADTLYQMIVTDTNGCMDTIEVRVTVLIDDKVYIPNAITSNGLPGNKNFTIYTNENIPEIKLMYIYDRWGEQIFSLHDFVPNDPSIGWNGKFHGKECVAGVYTYFISYVNIRQETKKVSGTITLIR